MLLGASLGIEKRVLILRLTLDNIAFYFSIILLQIFCLDKNTIIKFLVTILYILYNLLKILLFKKNNL